MSRSYDIGKMNIEVDFGCVHFRFEVPQDAEDVLISESPHSEPRKDRPLQLGMAVSYRPRQIGAAEPRRVTCTVELLSC